jgi:hypothetical protein
LGPRRREHHPPIAYPLPRHQGEPFHLPTGVKEGGGGGRRKEEEGGGRRRKEEEGGGRRRKGCIEFKLMPSFGLSKEGASPSRSLPSAWSSEGTFSSSYRGKEEEGGRREKEGGGRRREEGGRRKGCIEINSS